MSTPPPTKYAFLVIDMQEHFRNFAGKIVIELNRIIETCREYKIPIITTQHGHVNVDFDGGVLAEHWGKERSIQVNTRDWELLPELDIKRTDIKITEKRRYDAFYGTILDDILRQLKVDTLIIGGTMTNLCCETTARSAFTRDYKIIFLSDGTATASEDMHQATLMNIEYGFGRVMSGTELRKMLKQHLKN